MIWQNLLQIMNRRDKELINEASKRFKQIMEYTIANGSLMIEKDDDTNHNSDNKPIGDDDDANEVDTMQSDDEVINVSGITDSQEETENGIKAINSKFEKALKAVENLESLIQQNDNEIEALTQEFKRHNPTQMDKLDLHSVNMKQKYIKCPLNYIGGKTKLLPQILPLFPDNINTFVDVFCGGANVSVNVNANKIIANDFNDKVIDIFKAFQSQSINEIIDYVENKIQEYGLNKTNREGYLKFRDDYNNSKDKNPIDLFILICHSFNNQIRFNSKGGYNMPFGMNRSEFNGSIKDNLIKFCESIKNIKFCSNDFREIKLEKLSSNDFIYCDPPYLITCAPYNDGWNENDERDLYKMLDNANARGIKFAMSNVLSNKGKENVMLSTWVSDNNYTIHHLNQNYSNCNYHIKDKDSKTDEILITNY